MSNLIFESFSKNLSNPFYFRMTRMTSPRMRMLMNEQGARIQDFLVSRDATPYPLSLIPYSWMQRSVMISRIFIAMEDLVQIVFYFRICNVKMATYIQKISNVRISIPRYILTFFAAYHSPHFPQSLISNSNIWQFKPFTI